MVFSLRGHAIAISDQALSSATNFIAVLAMARGLDPESFGVFALAYTALTLFLGLSRAFFGIPVALAAKKDPATLSRLYSNSMSSMLLLAIPVAVIVAIAGIVSAQEHRSTLLVLSIVVAATTPLTMMQDISRYYAIARGTPKWAILSDSLWLAGIIALAALAPMLGAFLLGFGWVTVAAVALVVMLPSLRPRISMADGAKLLIPRRGLRESVAVTVALSTGVTLAMGFLMIPFLGALAVGTIRGAGTLFGPVNTLIALLDFSILGSLARRARAKDLRSVFTVAAALAVASATWALILLLIPSSVGRLLLGASWSSTRSILPITSLEYVLLCIAAGLAVLFKLRDRPRILLMNRVVSSLIILLSATVFLALGGGVAWMALSLLLGAAVSAGGMTVSALRERGRAERLETAVPSL